MREVVSTYPFFLVQVTLLAGEYNWAEGGAGIEALFPLVENFAEMVASFYYMHYFIYFHHRIALVGNCLTFRQLQA